MFMDKLQDRIIDPLIASPMKGNEEFFIITENRAQCKWGDVYSALENMIKLGTFELIEAHVTYFNENCVHIQHATITDDESYSKKIIDFREEIPDNATCLYLNIIIKGEFFEIGPVMGYRRNSPEIREWKKNVLNRDNHTCQCCGVQKHLEVHHISSFTENPHLRVDVNNGIVLCKWCHGKYHSLYGIKGANPYDFVNFLDRFKVGGRE